MFEEDLELVLSNGTEVWYLSGFGCPAKVTLRKGGESVLLVEEDALELAKYVYKTFDRSIAEERKQHRANIRKLHDTVSSFLEGSDF